MPIVENLDSKIKEFWPKDGPSTNEIEKYIKKYSREKIVIKCGGRILLDPNLFRNFIDDKRVEMNDKKKDVMIKKDQIQAYPNKFVAETSVLQTHFILKMCKY